MFLAFFVLVFVLGGDFIFDWFELVELFRLYLGASLCILSFSSCHFVFTFLVTFELFKLCFVTDCQRGNLLGSKDLGFMYLES